MKITFNYLRGGIDPDLGFPDLVPVRVEEELETLHGPGQGDAPDDEGDEEEDGQRGGDVDNLPRGGDSLPQAEVHDDPGEDEEAQQLQPDGAHVVDTFRHLQHSVAGRKIFLKSLERKYFDLLEKFLSSGDSLL